MTAEKLTATRSGNTLAITGETPVADLPAVVLTLGISLTVEITPGSNIPVRLATEDYADDKERLEALIGAETISFIEGIGDGTCTVSFTPCPDWDLAVDLAMQQWNLSWNPLPLDPELLALDLLRAQHESIALTGTLPDQNLAKTAYPAAQALQRLLNANAITAEAQATVARALDASSASTPLNYTDTTPYTLSDPLTQAEIQSILDPAPPTPGALATGSPDWRLTGHGPVATAENTITVLPHKTNQDAVTIIAPAKPRSRPERTPVYQALITDPTTGHTIATTTLRYNGATNTYTGHTTPRRPITSADLVDIRHRAVGAGPLRAAEERLAAYRVREAIRAHTAAHPAPSHSLTDLAQRNLLLTDGVGAPFGFVDFITQSDYVLAAKSEHREQTGSAEFGSIGASWTIDRRGRSMHLAIDAPSVDYPPLSGVRIRVSTETDHATYLIAFAVYDTEYVVSELRMPLPLGKFTVSVDASRIDFLEQSRPPEGLLAESINGSGPETLEAWRSIAERAPRDSAFAHALAKILSSST